MNLAHIRLEDVKKNTEEKKSLPQPAEEKPKSKYKVVKLYEAETAESEDAE